MRKWGNECEQEVRRRIKIAVYAYAYEFDDCALVSDSEFDALALMIRPSLSTGKAELDRFFLNQFDPSTGLWIYKHPQLDRVAALYRQFYAKQTDGVTAL